MKKLIIFLSFLVCAMSFNLFAQESSGKSVVFIDYFSRPSNISDSYAEALRGKVIEGIYSKNRVRVVDVASQAQLNDESERRKAESAMADATARTTQMRTLGANYIVSGDIASMTTAKKVDSKTNEVTYNGAVQWTVKVVNAADGTIALTKTYNHSANNSVQEQALIKAFDDARSKMNQLVEAVFPLRGQILKVENVSKKGDKAKEVIIDLGSTVGLQKGQRLNVYAEVDIVGEVSLTQIGVITTKDVLSAGRALCAVSKGDKEILDAMKEERKCVVVSTAQSGGILGGINDALDAVNSVLE